MPNYGPNQILDLNTSLERSHSKLSENYNILKWITRNKVKDFQLHPLINGSGTLFSRSNFTVFMIS